MKPLKISRNRTAAELLPMLQRDFDGSLPKIENLMPRHIRDCFDVQNAEIEDDFVRWEWSYVISQKCAVCFGIYLSDFESFCTFEKVIFRDEKGGHSRDFYSEVEAYTDLDGGEPVVPKIRQAFQDGADMLKNDFLMDLNLILRN